MLKLVKYEFRKALGVFLALLGCVAALEVYFLIALETEQETHMAASMILLVLCAFAAAVFVFVRGITSYSGELNSKTSYLVFMTPNPTAKVVGSKFLYTFFNGLLFAALLAALAGLDFVMMLRKFDEYESFMMGMKSLLSMNGVYVDQILYAGLFMVVYAFLSVISTIAVAYFAITLSHTLFRDKKWRWLPALVIFIGVTWLVNWICGQFPSAVDQMTMVEFGEREDVVIVADAMWSVVVPSLLPTAGVSLIVILASLFGCSALLEHKVSL